jgi:hypothetical protein
VRRIAMAYGVIADSLNCSSARKKRLLIHGTRSRSSG